MKHEHGYCDDCGACVVDQVAWLTIDGGELCTECAIKRMAQAVRVPTKREARDDGR